MSVHVPPGQSRGVYGWPMKSSHWYAFREFRLDNRTGVALEISAVNQDENGIVTVQVGPGWTEPKQEALPFTVEEALDVLDSTPTTPEGFRRALAIIIARARGESIQVAPADRPLPGWGTNRAE